MSILSQILFVKIRLIPELCENDRIDLLRQGKQQFQRVLAALEDKIDVQPFVNARPLFPVWSRSPPSFRYASFGIAFY